MTSVQHILLTISSRGRLVCQLVLKFSVRWRLSCPNCAVAARATSGGVIAFIARCKPCCGQGTRLKGFSFKSHLFIYRDLVVQGYRAMLLNLSF